MNITIDGQRVAAQLGETVYQAAKKAGIAIPSLCASDHLNPFGSCRLCLCEIEGQSGTPATCTTPAREGLVVQTETKRLQRLPAQYRRVVSLRTAGCWSRAGGAAAPGRCVWGPDVRYHNPARRLAYRDDSNPFFSFDNVACVSCARCVRACDEIQGTFALTMIGRGFSARPAAGAGSLMGEAAAFTTSNCVSCGACVKECPTGALTEKTVLEPGAPVETVRTTCAYCGVGCAMTPACERERL